MLFNENMIRRLQKIINSIENSPTTFWLWLAAFSSIIIVRLLVENWLGNFQNKTGLFIFYEFTHTFLFFLIAYLLFLWILHKFLKIGFKKISNILLWGYLLIITPPIIDFVVSGGKGFWSFYKFDGIAGLFRRFLTFFGDKPEIGITYGVRMEVALALVFMFIYSFIKLSESEKLGEKPRISAEGESVSGEKNKKTKELKFEIWTLFENLKLKIENLVIKYPAKIIIKSLVITFIAYFVFFILGTFPSWIAIAFKGFTKGFLSVGAVDTAQMFLAPAKIFSREIPEIVSSLNIKMSLVYSLVLAGILLPGMFFIHRQKFLSFLKNARFPQLIYHGGLLCAGIGSGMIFTAKNWSLNFFNVISFFVLVMAIFSAWLTSVVINDLEDEEIDKKTNVDRPLVRKIFSPREYQTLGTVLFAISLLFAAIVNFKIALLLLVYQAIAWIYSAWPFRLKRFTYVSTFVSSLASLIVFFSGFILVSPGQNISNLPRGILALLVISYTLSLPIKDFKDIDGDKENGVRTVPVVFGEYWGKIIVGSGIFLSFLFSVVFLNEPRLFWQALLFGTAAFWTVFCMKKNPAESRFNYRNIFWWILGLIFVYGLILVKTIL